MQFKDFLGKMTPEIYQVLRQSIESGRWPNGGRLCDQEREAGLQALIAWEHRHLPENERTGYMPVSCQRSRKQEEPANILRFKDS